MLFLISFWLLLGEPDIRLEKALAAFEAGRYSESLALFEPVKEHWLETDFTRYAYGTNLHVAQRFEEALRQYEQLPDTFSLIQLIYYNRACIASTRGEINKAAALLERSYLFGYKDYEHIRTDPEIKNLRESEGFFIPTDKVIEHLTLKDGAQLTYDLHRPMGDVSSKGVLLVFGAGGQSAEGRSLAETRYFGYALRKRGWCIVMPWRSEVSWYSELGKARLSTLIDHVKHRYVKGLPLHVFGLLDGGAVAFLATSLRPADVTSLNLLPGVSRDDTDPTTFANLKGVDVRLVYHSNFPMWWLKRIERMEASFKSAGVPLRKIEMDHYFKMFPGLRAGKLEVVLLNRKGF